MRTKLPDKFYLNLVEEMGDGHHQINTLTLRNSDIAQFSWELKVTNGLGYIPVRKKMKESKVHNEVGLMRHLANMDYITLLGKHMLLGATLEEVGNELIGLERGYNMGINYLINLIRSEREQIDKSISERREQEGYYSQKFGEFIGLFPKE